ncbi:DNA ligase 1 isoform X3 [Contarinia nasturtii]|uniref:DNA ligase 1 isoform X3 n=1 Tax=Contarinia nasturtii TaxID=265458 RepID=UPI0012D4C084|nr:DNA ligase 1 isoform X3 [Contarinia nasturtii]
MNGQTYPSSGDGDVIPTTDDKNLKSHEYGEKKRMSLKLPLLNVVVTNAVADDHNTEIQDEVQDEKCENDSEKMDLNGESSKKKKIYESDDTFIQAIFSQTIKSTTATPTDDEPSQDFDTYKQSSKSGEDDIEGVATTSELAITPADDRSEPTNDEPAAKYTYFHQTIEEDDSPVIESNIESDVDINVTNDSVTCNPISPQTTTIYTHNDKTEINICTETKEDDEFSEKDASIDNSLNNTSTAYASNEAITESEHSLTQLNSFESDQSESQKGDEQVVVTSEKTTIEKSSNKKKSSENGTEKKKKSKKSKKSVDEKENISVGSTEGDKTCRSCGKIVYKMEEIKAEKSVWHKNCFRCSQCSKPLNVDTFESHESVLYCKLHFKSLFSPKAVEDTEPEAPRKPELIIRESQPIELPPDVVRSSDKSDLGLSELHQLNVKERYNIFENAKKEESHQLLEREERVLKRGTTVLSKLAKFKAKGMDVGDAEANLATADESGGDEDEYDEDVEDIDLLRAKEAQIERPLCSVNMDDIKSKFESGHSQSREERREERKQEIQSIRSRLFMGKQAKIKEMYQQAVADSEQCVRASNKKPDVDIGDKARSIKSKFENGEVFKDEQNHSHQIDDSAVFEHGLGKQSRSIFMEIDAKATSSPQHTPSSPGAASSKRINPVWPPEQKENTNGADIVKYDEKVDEVKIKTADISSKFKFFETYKPESKEKKPFRITPPRDGVVPQNNETEQEQQQYEGEEEEEEKEAGDIPPNGIAYIDASRKAAQRSSTTTKMLSMFRQMEDDVRSNRNQPSGLKPLKSFTPPPDDGRRLVDRNSQSGSEYTDSEDESEEDSDNEENKRPMDEALQQAQAAARAKQLRAKFEKWEQKEIKREQERQYDGEDQSQIDTRCIRAKFESLRNAPSSPSREKIQVNRFV